MDPVRNQYETLPYPPRDPRDETTRLITGSPSQLWELNHYVFAGRRDFSRPFRALVAGGGTGDACVMLAQQLWDIRCPAEVVYVDLSAASRAVAESRVRARGLTNVTFHTLSLLDLPAAGFPPFDYIDCSGVLHHLPSPEAGLKVLSDMLAVGGGMGVMLYGELGRTGVYAMQEMLRQIASEGPPADRIAVARRLIDALPQTNWLRRNPFVGDHLAAGDAGLFDLLLHARDRAYQVPEIAALLESARLRLAGWAAPAAYDPALHLQDPVLMRRIAELDPIERSAFAERLSGNLRKHVFYAIAVDRPEPIVAEPSDGAIPLLTDDAPDELAAALRKGRTLTITFEGVRLNFAMPRLAAALVSRIDGRRTVGSIYDDLRTADSRLTHEDFARQFEAVYRALNGIGRLFLRFPPSASS